MSYTLTHNPPYTITGAAGAAVDATSRTLADLGITQISLTLRSMAADTLRMVCEGALTPEWMQAITVHDAAARRIFTGLVTDLEEEWDGQKLKTTVTVSGPWWWLDQVQLTSIIADSVGTTQERAIYTFPSQLAATSISSLMTRLVALGVPLTLGTVDSTFICPQMQFQNGTGESILTTILGWMPDSATHVRYDLAGTPTLEVRRRATAPTVTYDLADAANLAEIPTLTEQRSLIPVQVKVQTMSVNASGQIIYGEQLAGNPTPPTPLGRQILSLSGPGRGDFEAYSPRIGTLRTQLVYGYDHGTIWSLALLYDPVVMAAEEIETIPFSSFAYYGGYGATKYNSDIFPGNHKRIIAGSVNEWMTSEFGITTTTVRVTGWVFGTYPSAGWDSGAADLRDQGRQIGGFFASQHQMAIFVDFTMPVASVSNPTLTVYVHPDDQALVTPVANLATNIYNAQNYAPISGSVPLTPGATLPLPGTKININGGLTKWTTMGAMSNGLSLDLRTGSANLSLGRASRISASSLLDQFSRPLSGKTIKA